MVILQKKFHRLSGLSFDYKAILFPATHNNVSPLLFLHVSCESMFNLRRISVEERTAKSLQVFSVILDGFGK